MLSIHVLRVCDNPFAVQIHNKEGSNYATIGNSSNILQMSRNMFQYKALIGYLSRQLRTEALG